MTKFRKLTLFTMLIISIAAVICGGLFAFNNTDNNSNSKSNASKLETEEYSGPTGLLERGDKWDIDLKYIPDKDSMSGDNVQQVYEYSVSNSSSKNSLLLKLDSTPTMENMSISFVFSDTRISDHSTLVGGSYEDKMLEAGSKKYVYLIASVIDSSKTASYTDDIDWLIGKPLELTYNLSTGTSTTGYAVMGAPMKSLTAPVVEGYNFVGWYTDSSYSNAVTFPLTLSATRTLYAKYTIDWPENYLPTDWLAWDSTTSSYYVTKGTSTLPTELIIPSQYDDGTHGTADITYIEAGYSIMNEWWEEEYIGIFSPGTILTSVTLPSTLTYIGEYAFAGYGGLEINTLDMSRCSNLTTGYDIFDGASIGELILPTKWTSIPDSLCAYSSVETVIVPSGITSIGPSAFAYTNLSSINLEDCIQLSSIEFGAFTGSSLTSITIPISVTSIGDFAFSSCSGLTSITIPSSVTSIGGYAFAYCTSLTSITIPSGVTSISDYAFYYCDGLTDVTISASVTSIGTSAFEDCSGLTSITIPSSVTSIGNYAFYDCSGLTSITIPSSVTSIGTYAFYGCSSLTSVTFEGLDTATWYQTSSSDYTNGTKITEDLSNTSTAVTCLKSTYSTKYWYKEEAAVSDGNLPSDWLAWDSNTNSYYVKKGTSTLPANLIIPSTYNDGTHGTAEVEYIGEYAFVEVMYENSLSVTIPSTIKRLEPYAFSACFTQMDIIFAEDSQLTSIPNNAFYESLITSITIPASVTSIGEYAFGHCAFLTIIFADNSQLTTIGDNAFFECWGELGDGSFIGLSNITIPRSVTSIGRGAFYFCRTLTSVTFEDDLQLTSIGDSAFQYCSGLTSITIPSSVTSIGDSAFFECYGLTSVTFEGLDTATWYQTSSSSYTNGTKITEDLSNTSTAATCLTSTHSAKYWYKEEAAVSDGNLPSDWLAWDSTTSSYYVTTGSSELPADLIIPSAYNDGTHGEANVTSIGDYAFEFCGELTSITIPSSVTSIGNSAFEFCSELTSITIPSSVTSIGNSAFGGCSDLTSIVVESGNRVYDSRDNCNAIIETSTNTLTHGCKATIIPNTVTSIGDYAFQYCSELTSITIPSSVTSIGDSAFSYCSGLTSITIPSSVTSIGNNAFQSCDGLTSITIPSSVTSIGAVAFSECSGLTSIAFEDNSQLTSIGNYAFFECFGLTSITIPSSVTSIGTSAFFECFGLTSVTFEGLDTATWYQTSSSSYTNGTKITEDLSDPEVAATCLTSTYVYQYWYKEEAAVSDGNLPSDWLAWDSNTNSYYVKKGTSTLPADLVIPATYDDGTHGEANVTYIADADSRQNGVFYSQTSLISVTIPNTIISIGDYAFDSCGVDELVYEGLSSITIPSSVQSIGKGAFEYCVILTSVTFGDNSQLISIGDSAFYGCYGLTSITIPSSVTSIGDYAFSRCGGLTSITIPSSVTSIGNDTFSNCVGLTSITFGDNSQLTSIGNNAFQYCSKLTSITIPSSVTSIGYYAFQLCSKLTSITFDGSSVTSIGNYAFYGCSKLTSITIPTSVKKIGQWAFYQSGVKTATFKKTSTWYYTSNSAYTSGTSLTASNILNTTTAATYLTDTYVDYYWYVESPAGNLPSDWIEYVSAGYYNVKRGTSALPADLIIPETYDDGTHGEALVTHIDNTVGGAANGVFYGQTVLTSVVLPYGIIDLGCGSFYGCTNLKTVVIEGLVELHSYVFYNCTSLTRIVIPSTLTYLSTDGYQFYGCTSLVSASLPAGITSIPKYMFYNCTSLTTVNIPSTVTSIGNYAFYKAAIADITIPEGVTTISTYAFYNCTSLSSITIPASVKTIGTYAFNGCSGATSLNFATGSQLTTISDYAFLNCTSITSVIIPSTVTSMGIQTFKGCSSLVTVTFKTGSTLKILPANAFESCTELTTAVIPASLTKVNAGAFLYCSKLSSINLGDCTSLTNIEQSAFHTCSALTSVTIPSTVTYIGPYAFLKTGLTSVTLPAGLQYLYHGAFGYCSSLTSVNLSDCTKLTKIYYQTFNECTALIGNLVIPSNVTTIEYDAFKKTQITSVTMSNKVTSIGDSAFRSCTSLTKVTLSTALTSIESNVFYDCTALASVNLGDCTGLTTMGDAVFNQCKALTSIVIPDTVTSLGQYAFNNCTSLVSVNIPASATAIGDYAFYYCEKLTASLVIPANVMTIGIRAFRGIASTSITFTRPAYWYYTASTDYTGGTLIPQADLENVTTATTHIKTTYYTSYWYREPMENEWMLTWLSWDESTSSYQVIKGYGPLLPTELVIPATYNDGTHGEANVSSIAAGTSSTTGVFAGITTLTSITLPSSLTSIGAYTFYGCTSLTTVTFADGSQLTSIGNYAFRGCTSLNGIIIPEGVTSIGSYAFYGCSSLASVTIPEGVTSIGVYAFYNCDLLTSVTFAADSQLTTIGNYAFYDCDGLISITIPATVTKIGYQAFYSCGSLTSITFETTDNWYYTSNSAYTNGTSINVSTPATNATYLTSTYTYRYWYHYSTEIPEMTGNLDSSWFSYDSTSNSYHVVKGTTTLSGEITIPTHWDDGTNGKHYVTKIADGEDEASGVFANSSITNVIFPDTLTTIGAYAFNGCTGLTSIVIASGVTDINMDAFVGCTNLTSIEFEYTYYLWDRWCYSVPEGFLPMSALSDVKDPISNATWMLCMSNVTFNRTDSVATTGNPKADWIEWDYTTDSYQLVKGTSTLPATLVIPSTYNDGIHGEASITKIADGASSELGVFANQTSLTSVTLPEGLIRIGDYAFYGCTGITSITIPANAEYIGDDAFVGCTNLTSATFADDSYDWWYLIVDNGGFFPFDPEDVSNPATNATKLKASGYYWSRDD